MRFAPLALLAVLASGHPAHADDNTVPPDIAALLAKVARHEQLTPDEMNKVIEYEKTANQNAFGQQHGGFQRPKPQGPPGPPPGAMPSGSIEDATPTLDAKFDVAKRAKLDKAAYVALVGKILANDKDFIGSTRADEIRKAAGTKPGRMLVIGAALALAGDGAGALYAVALAAAAAPTSSSAANALGVQLQGANLYGRSWDVLVYADSLVKDDATIQSNLGYAAMYLGDARNANVKFARALQLDPSRAEAHLGLGLLAKAQGDTKGALTNIRAAVARGASDDATQLDEIVQVQAEPLSGNNDPVHAAATPIGDDPGFKAGGGIVLDLTAKRQTVFPLWTPPADPAGVAAFSDVLAGWLIQHRNDPQQLHAARVAARDAANAAIPAYLKAHSKDGVTIPRFDLRVITVLDDYNVIYQARVREALRPFDEARSKALKIAMSATDTAKCEQRPPIARQLNASLGGAYAPAATKLKATVEQYFRDTDPYIDSIWQPDLQRSMQLQRRELLAGALLHLREGMSEWSGALAVIGCNGAPSAPDAHKSSPVEEPTVTDPTPTKCPLPTGHASLGVVSIDISCEGLTIQGGEGLFGGVDVRFKGPSGHLEQKIFIGVGAEGDFGPAKGEGKAVLWITKAGGHVVDVGAEYGVSGKIDVKGAKFEGDFGLSASWRAGPNISGSGKTTLFGAEQQLWKI